MVWLELREPTGTVIRQLLGENAMAGGKAWSSKSALLTRIEGTARALRVPSQKPDYFALGIIPKFAQDPGGEMLRVGP